MMTPAEPFTTPDELLQPTPRPARFTVWTQTQRTFLYVLLICGTGLLCFLGLHDLSDLQALRANGAMIRAQVIDKHERHGKSTSYILDYEYIAAGTTVDDHTQVNWSDYENTNIGDGLGVTYLPSAPNTHRVGPVTDERITHQRRNWVIGILGFIVLFGGILFFAEREFGRHLFLLREGVSGVGTIISKEIVRGRNTIYYLTYQYHEEYQMFSRRVRISARAYRSTSQGQQVPILIQPGNPAYSMPYLVLTDVTL